jgi:hypothetical protein
MIGSRFNPRLTFSQPTIRSAGSHTNATSQQPAAAGGGGGGGTPSTLPKSGVLITNPAGTAVADLNDYNVQAYGAVISAAGSAAANVTAINTAIAAMNAAGGGRLLFPGAGAYFINAALTTITVPCEIVGMGWSVTTINQSSNGGVFNLNVTGNNSACWIHGLGFIGPGNASTNGSALIFGNSGTSASDMNQYSLVEFCYFADFYVGVDFVNATQTSIRCCLLACGYGSRWDCPYNPDQGAGIIEGCTITSTISGVFVPGTNGADGLQVLGNIFYGSQYAIQIIVGSSVGGIDYWVCNNHIEGYSITGLLIDSAGAGTASNNWMIVGNEFAPASGATTGACMQIKNTGGASSPWIRRMTVVGNTAVASAGGTGCFLIAFTQNGVMDANAFGGITTQACVTIASSCVNFINGNSNTYSSAGTLVTVTDSQTYTVATLPPSPWTGQRSWVADATVTTFASNVAGLGANVVPVMWNATHWIIG